jgi:hypothetical protein
MQIPNKHVILKAIDTWEVGLSHTLSHQTHAHTSRNGSSDPFCKVLVDGKETGQTSVQENTMNPGVCGGGVLKRWHSQERGIEKGRKWGGRGEREKLTEGKCVCACAMFVWMFTFAHNFFVSLFEFRHHGLFREMSKFKTRRIGRVMTRFLLGLEW